MSVHRKLTKRKAKTNRVAVRHEKTREHLPSHYKAAAQDEALLTTEAAINHSAEMAAVLYDEASAANNSPVLLFFSALLTTKAVNHSQRKNVRSQRYQGIPDLRCDAFPYVSFCSLAGASIDARCAPLESPIIKCRAAQFGPAVSRERFSRAVHYNA